MQDASTPICTQDTVINPTHPLVSLVEESVIAESSGNVVPDSPDDFNLPTLVANHIQDAAWASPSRYHQATVEDASDDEDFDMVLPDESPEDAATWNRLFKEEDMAADDEYVAISVWDKLAESFIQEGLVTGAS